jgi:hypothetical protein
MTNHALNMYDGAYLSEEKCILLEDDVIHLVFKEAATLQL